MTGFALGIRYLTGYAVATNPASRELAEWPPHPGRVFMALAAAHFETGEETGEGTALEWLESLKPPVLRVSDADARTVVTHFVPVNDKAGPSKAPLQSAPEFTRERAGRTFPRVRPHDETAYLMWPGATPDSGQRQALERLCAKVIRIGHSSSLVQMWYAGKLNGSDLILAPTEGPADVNLRIVGPGTLAYLRRQHNGDAVEAFVRLSDAITNSRGTGQREAKEEFKSGLRAGLETGSVTATEQATRAQPMAGIPPRWCTADTPTGGDGV